MARAEKLTFDDRGGRSDVVVGNTAPLRRLVIDLAADFQRLGHPVGGRAGRNGLGLLLRQAVDLTLPTILLV